MSDTLRRVAELASDALPASMLIGLVQQSQHTNTKLRIIAQDIVDNITTDARNASRA
jgi:hypothetical protein